jgi:hypothetical protein
MYFENAGQGIHPFVLLYSDRGSISHLVILPKYPERVRGLKGEFQGSGYRFRVRGLVAG